MASRLTRKISGLMFLYWWIQILKLQCPWKLSFEDFRKFSKSPEFFNIYFILTIIITNSDCKSKMNCKNCKKVAILRQFLFHLLEQETNWKKTKVYLVMMTSLKAFMLQMFSSFRHTFSLTWSKLLQLNKNSFTIRLLVG